MLHHAFCFCYSARRQQKNKLMPGMQTKAIDLSSFPLVFQRVFECETHDELITVKGAITIIVKHSSTCMHPRIAEGRQQLRMQHLHFGRLLKPCTHSMSKQHQQTACSIWLQATGQHAGNMQPSCGVRGCLKMLEAKSTQPWLRGHVAEAIGRSDQVSLPAAKAKQATRVPSD